MAVRIVEMMVKAVPSFGPEQRARFQAVAFEACTRDAWDEPARACHAEMIRPEDGHTCSAMLSEAQRAALDQQMTDALLAP